MLNAKPRVSIGLPVYNGEKYLEEALDSILAQTYKDFELIISDNASTDRTQEICLRYAQKETRIRYHRSERNLGAAPNHNLVFNLAQGKYFKWAGYDDKISPDFLSRCVEILDKNPDVVLCMPKTCLIDERGIYLNEFKYRTDANLQKQKMRFRNFLLYNFSGNYVYGLMRVQCVAQTALHGSFPSSDLAFLAELTFYGKYYIVPECLFFRRYHPEQSTKGVWKRERARSPWFDTALEGKIVFPKWSFLFSCLYAIKRAPLNVYDRTICYAYMIYWVLLPQHMRALGKDVLLAIQQVVINSISRIKNRK